ncbi:MULTISPECIES: hypothetical protein [Exiguobacterium]|uniref:hypothetical protein n=1 Tax=Exiguobacterium TaxID=33986 RepID=UPI0028AA90D8|nr:hypothetical protein [Exiguobacterium sp.]
MIKNKKVFLFSLLLISIGVVGAIILDYMGYFPDATARFLSIPVASYEESFIHGWILSGVTCMGLFALPFSLKERKVATTSACMVAVIIIPFIV